MHATIEFPFPEEESRRQFKLSGGNIKNIALHASCLAAEEDAAIGMAHLRQATK